MPAVTLHLYSITCVPLYIQTHIPYTQTYAKNKIKLKRYQGMVVCAETGRSLDLESSLVYTTSSGQTMAL